MSDAFSDIRGGITAKHGIFSQSEGLDDLDHAQTEFAEDGSGINIGSRCENCGANQVATVGWQELFVIANKMVPANWWYDRQNGLIRVNQLCVSCGRAPIPWGLTPDECQRRLAAGVQGGKLNEQQLAAWAARLQQQPRM